MHHPVRNRNCVFARLRFRDNEANENYSLVERKRPDRFRSEIRPNERLRSTKIDVVIIFTFFESIRIKKIYRFWKIRALFRKKYALGI